MPDSQIWLFTGIASRIAAAAGRSHRRQSFGRFMGTLASRPGRFGQGERWQVSCGVSISTI